MCYSKNIPIKDMINSFKNTKLLEKINQLLVKQYLEMHKTPNKNEIINRLGLKKNKMSNNNIKKYPSRRPPS